MRNTCAMSAAVFAFLCVSFAQNAVQPSARTDIYHVHFAKAALGKGAEEGDFLRQPDPNSPMKGHYIVLRHQDGAEWDYAVIEHLGTTATVKATGNPPPPNARDLSAWHADTFVNGPAWPDFAKAMGLDDPTKSKASVYVLGVFRAAPGHRDDLEKALSQPPGQADAVAGNVLMQHLEGGPWNFLTLTRYNSWQDFATSEKTSVAETLKPDGGWLAVRNHSTYHNDTITDRIAP